MSHMWKDTMNKLTKRSQQELMDGYDVEIPEQINYTGMITLGKATYRVYRYEKPKVGKPVKVYKFGYPDYKSMIQKHPELKVLQLI